MRKLQNFEERQVNRQDPDRRWAFLAESANPYGLPVVVGTDLYVGAKMKGSPHMNEAFRYSFERLILYDGIDEDTESCYNHAMWLAMAN